MREKGLIMGIIINQANLEWNGKLKERTSTDFLIFHHAEASVCSIELIHSWHKEPPRNWIGIGYNFFIRKDGSIWEGRPIWAADADAYGYNNNSLSCGFEGDFMIEHMTEAQVESGITLARHCRKLYPKIRLCRHKDVNTTECPGTNFDNRIIFEGSVDIVEVNNIKDAIDTLVREKRINSPEYWQKAADTTYHVAELLIDYAKYVNEHK
jgi:hypothetical protein